MEFTLKDKFIEKYSTIEPDFGFNGLGNIVYLRTYSRIKEDGTNEKWFETIRRVVEGTYSIQKKHITNNGLGWDEEQAYISAEEMYDRMFTMKFLPPGRGLWAMGTKLINERGLFAALNNCAFVSTESIATNLSKPFEFMMDMSMLGVGVGFDTKGVGKIRILKPLEDDFFFQIPDTREGWVESLKHSINAFLCGYSIPKFDYSLIRDKGTLIKTFGGKSAGPQPLKDLHSQIIEVLTKRIGQLITETDIVDIMNMIGVCVVAGNARRSSQIVFGNPASNEFLKLKDYHWDQDTQQYRGSKTERAPWGWLSNNSVFAEIGIDYTKLAEQTALNGEPGYAWLNNMKAYGRFKDGINNKDFRVAGGNPCFSGSTKLKTPNGYITLEDLAKEEVFQAFNKDGIIVDAKAWSNGTKPTCRISFLNKEPIIATKDHRFMLNDGTEEIAENLKGKRLMPFVQTNKIIDENVKFGFLQGDGNLGRLKSVRHLGIEVDFSEKDIDVANIFGFSETGSKYITGYKKTLNKLEFDSNPLSIRALPDYIMFNKDKEIIKSFLKGLYTANGSVIKHHRVSLKSTCKYLIRQVENLLSKLEIDSYITTNKEKLITFSNGQYTCKESYDLNITKYASILRFAEYISFVQKYKEKDLISLLIERAPYVSTVLNWNIEEVFDFSLNDHTHWGVIEGIIAHNCLEQSLEPYEMCCLVEVFPTRHLDKTDFLRTLKFAYMYAKTVTLGTTGWVETNRVQLRNRRIGTSISGIAQFIDSKGLETLRQWLEDGYQTIQHYDDIYSEWFAIPRSIKTTSIKPSGTVSLLPGVTPGMHYPESNYYIRRIRVSTNSDLLPYLKEAGYTIEPDVNDVNNTSVVEIPVAIEGVRTTKEVSMWEQLSLAAFLQEHWADNQVSCTITFDKTEREQIKQALNYFQYKLKGISFLPKLEKAMYQQMPYEEITKEDYKKLLKRIKGLKLNGVSEDSKPEMYCNNDTCEIT